MSTQGIPPSGSPQDLKINPHYRSNEVFNEIQASVPPPESSQVPVPIKQAKQIHAKLLYTLPSDNPFQNEFSWDRTLEVSLKALYTNAWPALFKVIPYLIAAIMTVAAFVKYRKKEPFDKDFFALRLKGIPELILTEAPEYRGSIKETLLRKKIELFSQNVRRATIPLVRAEEEIETFINDLQKDFSLDESFSELQLELLKLSPEILNQKIQELKEKNLDSISNLITQNKDALLKKIPNSPFTQVVKNNFIKLSNNLNSAAVLSSPLEVLKAYKNTLDDILKEAEKVIRIKKEQKSALQKVDLVFSHVRSFLQPKISFKEEEGVSLFRSKFISELQKNFPYIDITNVLKDKENLITLPFKQQNLSEISRLLLPFLKEEKKILTEELEALNLENNKKQEKLKPYLPIITHLINTGNILSNKELTLAFQVHVSKLPNVMRDASLEEEIITRFNSKKILKQTEMSDWNELVASINSYLTELPKKTNQIQLQLGKIEKNINTIEDKLNSIIDLCETFFSPLLLDLFGIEKEVAKEFIDEKIILFFPEDSSAAKLFNEHLEILYKELEAKFVEKIEFIDIKTYFSLIDQFLNQLRGSFPNQKETLQNLEIELKKIPNLVLDNTIQEIIRAIEQE